MNNENGITRKIARAGQIWPGDDAHLLLWLFAIGSVAALLPVWLVHYPPVTDLPNHLLGAFTVVHLHDPAYDFARHFTVNLTPRSGILGHYLMIVLLRAGISPLLTEKIYMSLILLIAPWGVWWLLVQLRGRRDGTLIALFSLFLGYNWCFNMGFASFSLSVGLFTWGLAAWYRYRQAVWAEAIAWCPAIWAGLLTALLAIAAYLAHLQGAGTLLAAAGLLSLADLRRPKRWLLLWLPFLPLFLFLIWITASGQSSTDAIIGTPFIVWAPLSRKLSEFASGIVLRSFSPRREEILLALPLLIYLILLERGLRYRGLTRWVWPALFAVAAFFLLPIGLWVPFYIYQRMYLFAIWLGLPLLWIPQSKQGRLVVTAVLLICALLYYGNTGHDYAVANVSLQQYAQAWERLPGGLTIFPFDNFRQGRISPGAHFWAYYIMEKGGYSPYFFSESYHPVRYKPGSILPWPVAYAGGYFYENARADSTIWVRPDDPMMQRRVLPIISDYGYKVAGNVGPYRIYRPPTVLPPRPPEAEPHFPPAFVAAYDAIFDYGWLRPALRQEIERWFKPAVDEKWIRIYTKKPWTGEITHDLHCHRYR